MKKSMSKKILAVLLIGLLSACASAEPAKELIVTMNDFSFTPAQITVEAGQPVEISFVNEGTQEHDFVIAQIDVSNVVAEGSGMGEHHMSGEHVEYDLHISINAGETGVLKFTADEPGTYKILCSVEGHEEAGMTGELIVVSK
jgi:uncharacterized cupredoxin-like copper-binding protein